VFVAELLAAELLAAKFFVAGSLAARCAGCSRPAGVGRPTTSARIRGGVGAWSRTSSGAVRWEIHEWAIPFDWTTCQLHIVRRPLLEWLTFLVLFL